MSRTTLVLALLAVALLAGCTVLTESDAPVNDTDLTTDAPNASTPGSSVPVDEPPLDFDGANDTLGPDEPPHIVRLVNDGTLTHNVSFTVVRDGETVYEQRFRSFPNTTHLGEIDHVGNYTLTVTVEDGGTATETISADSFDCNYSTTRFDLRTVDPTVETSSTEIACSEGSDA
jgi:hypothetical protein